MIDPLSPFGSLLALASWLRSEMGSRQSKEKIIQFLERADTITAYLEWLRRKDQTQLIDEIERAKNELISEFYEVTPRLTEILVQINAAAGDLSERIREINKRVSLPVLFPNPLETRSHIAIALRGRDNEMARLKTLTDDILIIGQPGSGKTFLLREFALVSAAKFVLSNDEELVAAEVLATKPDIVIVDDAFTRQNIVSRLRHTRTTYSIPLKIVSVGWPFEKDELLQAFQIKPPNIIELKKLHRPEIGAIIKEVATARGMTVNDDFIRLAAQQARGQPGLAVSLTLAAIESSAVNLLSGEILLQDIGAFVQKRISREALTVLAAFACGGESGITISGVANALGKNIVLIKNIAERIALAGILIQTSKDILAVQPKLLRAALIKREFFPNTGPGLPWALCEQLINSSAEPVVGYIELFWARGCAGANIADDLLRDIALKLNDSRIWSNLASVDANNCRWVLSQPIALGSDLKRIALYHLPDEILPRMLAQSVNDDRPLNSHTEADLRIIQDWVHESWNDESARRRIILFEVTNKWLKEGGDYATAIRAFEIALDLTYQASKSDAVDPRKFHFGHGIIPFQPAKKVFVLWGRLVALLTQRLPPKWIGVARIVAHWAHPGIAIKQKLSDEYIEFLKVSLENMLISLSPFAQSNMALGRMIYLHSLSVGLNLDSANNDYLILYPAPDLDLDWESRRAKQIEAATELARKWRSQPFSEIVVRVSEWINQTNDIGYSHWNLLNEFWSALSEMVNVSEQEMNLLIEKIPANYIGAFIKRAFASGSLCSDVLETCLNHVGLAIYLLDPTLVDPIPELYQRLQPHFSQFRHRIAALCDKNLVSEPVLIQLLSESDLQLRFLVATAVLGTNNESTLSPQLRKLIRFAFFDGLFEGVSSTNEQFIHDVESILNYDKAIAYDVLAKLLTSEHDFHSFSGQDLRSRLIASLDKGEREKLLRLCIPLAHSEVPAQLVNFDIDLYKILLSNSKLEDFHLTPLEGDPTGPAWVDLAKAALQANYTIEDVVRAATTWHSWSGNLSSYYRQCIERFERLRENDDADIKAIAEFGLNSARSAYNFYRDRESKEEFDVYDG